MHRALPFLALAVAATGNRMSFDTPEVTRATDRPRHLEAPARPGRGWSGMGNLPPADLHELSLIHI